jgi:multidrug efflux pump subunit AcrA (membrane-fusion protein)
MAGIDDTIATLETKLKQAKARKQQLEARKRVLTSKKNRADDTRRKILVGTAILAKVDREEWPKARLLDMMNQTLTRLDDRALFDLDGKAEDAKQKPEPEQIIQPPTKTASFTPRPDTDEI